MDHHCERPNIEGLTLRDDDLEPQRELHLVAKIFRICAGLIALLAISQVIIWFVNRPPGNIGFGLLIGDTIRLIVFGALLIAIGDLASLFIITHYDVRAARILLTREAHMLREMGLAQGWLKPSAHAPADRRDDGTESESEQVP